MAETLKLGTDGQWATKDGSLLAYNDENGNYKPLPFDFTRASSATVVNKAGLIETVQSGIPRIDFLGNTNGALKLEPQSTNLITQSEAFGNSYWTKSGASIQGDPSTAGAELVTNGSFATDTDWTKGTGWTIGGGVASCDGTQTGNTNLYQPLAWANTNYLQTIEVIVTAGTLRIYGGNADSSITITSSGTYVFYKTIILSGNVNDIYIQGNSSFIGSVDNVSVKEVQGFTSPSADSPLNAFKLVESATTAAHFQVTSALSNGVIGNSYSSSIFAKKGENNKIQLSFGSGSFSNSYANFNLNSGTITAENNLTAKIELLPNGWYKCSATAVATNTGSTSSIIGLIDSDLSTRIQSYTGDGTSGIYIFGAQLEQSSYPTSYIPTQGSTVTRNLETCSDAGNATVFEDVNASGVLYAEISALANEGGVRAISLNDGSTQDRISIRYNSTSNQIQYQYNLGSVVQANITYNVTDVTANHKIAIRWAVNDFELFIDGVSRGTDVSGNVMSSGTLTTLDINGSSVYDYMYAKIKDIQVLSYQTDAEMIALTSL